VRVSISNIAWDPVEDDAVAELLEKRGVSAIDVAPGKYFPAPANAAVTDIARVRAAWEARGISIVGMQALLFGTTGLNVFGDDDSRDRMLAHLDHVCRIAAGLGVTPLVFGSPKNRDRGARTDEEVAGLSTAFFRRVGDVARAHGVVVCLEPNPPRYGANFMTTTEETATVVRRVDHAAIRMQLDTGALTITGEDPATLVARHGDLIGHVHASEPGLVPLGDGGTDHRACAAAVSRLTPARTVTIEMVATTNEPHLVSIDRALAVAVAAYA